MKKLVNHINVEVNRLQEGVDSICLGPSSYRIYQYETKILYRKKMIFFMGKEEGKQADETLLKKIRPSLGY